MKDFKLDDHPKIKSGFTVPENYFENFESVITSRLEIGEPKVIPLFTRKKVWIPAVAALLVLALMLPVYNLLNPNQEPDIASIENYLAYSDISHYELAAAMDQEDIDRLDSEIQIDDQAIEDILTTSTNFENYIID